MHHGKLTLGIATAGMLAVSLTLAAQPAFADYAPVAGDVVGVGSDTVQYASDFVADGDFLGDPGYNTLGNKFKVINLDATPDANARLAYGPDGVGSGTCAPGDGGTAGTGNQTSKHTDQPCTLNPTVVLRAGLSPVQRPNGSGAGAKAIATDTHHYISYARASSAQGSTLGTGFDSITIGNDPLAMLSATTTNAVPLSAAQLKLIYACTDTTWTSVGGSSGATIIPIIPQVGSGTRTSFLTAIGNPTLGSCVQTGEENDPSAIAAQSSPANAIEPMSGGRLNMFLGDLGDGTTNGVGGYFKDPSCSLNAIAAGSPSTCAAANDTISPAVKLWTTGSPSDSGALFDISRPLYIYFRDADITSSTPFQPGGTLNWVRTLLYNPCPNPGVTGNGCTTVGGLTFGPGGAPFYASAAGQGLISAAGIAPTYAVTIAGP
jgi:ABC-type phosphate transport system substrate-binding protein